MRLPCPQARLLPPSPIALRKAAGSVIAGRERYSVLVRYPRELRDTPGKIAGLLVSTPSGAHVTLGTLAHIGIACGPTLIKSENAVLNDIVYVDVRGRDIGSYVADDQRLVRRRTVLPAGYRLEWSGQFEALQRATARLRVVVPVTLAIISCCSTRTSRAWPRA